MAVEASGAVQTEEVQEELKLTEREVAIARGDDPDTVEEEVRGQTAEVSEEEEGESAEAGVTNEEAETETEEAEDKGWVTDELAELAGTFGLQRDDLSEFTDADDFGRFARFAAKRFHPSVTAPQTAVEKSEQEVSREGAEVAEGDGKKPEAAGKIDPQKFIDEGYDEQTVALAKALADSQTKLESIEQLISQANRRQAEVDAQRAQAANVSAASYFHDAVDKLNPERYGSSKDQDFKQAHDDNRRKLWEAAESIAMDLERRQVPASLETVLKRAELFVFGEGIRKEQQVELANKIKGQSAKRRPVGRNTRRPAGRQLPGESDDPVAAIANSPELVEFWKEHATS